MKITAQKKSYRYNRIALGVATSVLILSLNGHADTKKFNLDIKAKPTDQALLELAEASDMLIMFPAKITSGNLSPSVLGSLTVEAALEKLLAGTNLMYERDGDKVVLIKEKDTGKSSDHSKTSELEEVIVTAARREQALQDVPMAITAVDPQEFTENGLTTIGDVIAYTPGFDFLDGGGAPGSGSIAARGVGQMSSTAVVGIYIDDAPMSASSPYAWGANFFFDGLMADIERVELLKGPQGTLYGATSVGGAIKYITRKPSLDEVRGNTSVGFSSTKDGGFNTLTSGRISTPLIEDKLGITVSGFYENNAGFVDAVDTTSGDVIAEDTDGYENYGVSADLLYQISDKFSFRGKGFHQKSEYNGESTIAYDPVTLEPLYGENRSFADPAARSIEFTNYNATFEYEADSATLTSTSSYITFAHKSVSDLVPAGWDAIVDGLEGNPPGTTTSVPFFADVGFRKFVHEMRVTSDSNETLEWIAGFYYANESTYNDQVVTPIPTGFDVFEIHFPVDYKEYAAFGNVTYYLSPEFDVTGGVRISKNSQVLDVRQSGAFAGPEGQFEVEDTVDTWLFSARYRPTNDLTLYARVASGYRPASSNLPIIDPNSGQATSPLVRSDNLWSYELGAKGSLADGLLSYDLAVYYIDWEDFQTFITVSGVTVNGNAEHGVTAQGLEGSVTLNPFDGLSITSTFAYADSTLNEDEPGLQGAMAGQRMPGVSKITATTKARYDFLIGSETDAHIGGGIRYIGEREGDFPPAQNIPVDAYTLVDLNAGVSRGNIDVNFYITNLLDDSSFTSLLYWNGKGSVVTPRTAGISVSFDF